MPHYMFIYAISKTGYPTSFNGTEPWLERWKDKLTIMTTPESDFILFAKDGTEICEVVDGFPLASVDNIEYTPFVGYIEGNEKGQSGRLTIPYNEVIVQYKDGEDISVISTDSVINLASSDNMTMNISMSENKIKLLGEDNSDVTVQVTEVYDNEDYTSVELEGILEKDDAVEANTIFR